LKMSGFIRVRRPARCRSGDFFAKTYGFIRVGCPGGPSVSASARAVVRSCPHNQGGIPRAFGSSHSVPLAPASRAVQSAWAGPRLLYSRDPGFFRELRAFPVAYFHARRQSPPPCPLAAGVPLISIADAGAGDVFPLNSSGFLAWLVEPTTPFIFSGPENPAI
jgi:hypothetical protein